LGLTFAHAVKVQAARSGAGVSDLVGNMFVCAHCREPIEDAFVIGLPNLIAPNKYAVFFHRNRAACAEASGSRVSFFADCPKCKTKAHQSFDRTELPVLIKDGRLRFYCITCDSSWLPSDEESRDVARLLNP
jgi:hypothetical protein